MAIKKLAARVSVSVALTQCLEILYNYSFSDEIKFVKSNQKKRHHQEVIETTNLILTILNCKLSLDLQNVRPSVLPSFRPSVRPYHYISCSFYRILSISHTGHHYNVAGVMEETFFFFRVMFRVIFGPLKKA